MWLAQGGGRIESVRAGRLVESWFFPSAGDDPYGYAHVHEEVAGAAARTELGLAESGTCITVPLAAIGLRNDPVEYAHALRYEAQALRHPRAREAHARVP